MRPVVIGHVVIGHIRVLKWFRKDKSWLECIKVLLMFDKLSSLWWLILVLGVHCPLLDEVVYSQGFPLCCVMSVPTFQISTYDLSMSSGRVKTIADLFFSMRVLKLEWEVAHLCRSSRKYWIIPRHYSKSYTRPKMRMYLLILLLVSPSLMGTQSFEYHLVNDSWSHVIRFVK